MHSPGILINSRSERQNDKQIIRRLQFKPKCATCNIFTNAFIILFVKINFSIVCKRRRRVPLSVRIFFAAAGMH